MKQKCEKCLYVWISIKVNPKACPRCKARLDIGIYGNQGDDKDDDKRNIKAV